MSDKYYTCKNCEVIINEIKFNNINWYKIVKKEDKLKHLVYFNYEN